MKMQPFNISRNGDSDNIYKQAECHLLIMLGTTIAAISCAQALKADGRHFGIRILRCAATVGRCDPGGSPGSDRQLTGKLSSRQPVGRRSGGGFPAIPLPSREGNISASGRFQTDSYPSLPARLFPTQGFFCSILPDEPASSSSTRRACPAPSPPMDARAPAPLPRRAARNRQYQPCRADGRHVPFQRAPAARSARGHRLRPLLGQCAGAPRRPPERSARADPPT